MPDVQVARALRPELPDDPQELEQVATCALCGGHTFRPIRQWRDPLLFGPERWTLVECEGCALAFLSPRPARAAIRRFYPDGYGAHVAPPSAPARWHRRVSAEDARPIPAWMRWWIQLRQDTSWYRFPRWTGRGRVLDVGCGSGGRYLDVLRALGWTTHGVEPCADAVATARAGGHGAVAGDAEHPHFPEHSMDLVTIWHVLEHTHDPQRALDVCFRTLRPGGELSLCVPNWGSLQAKIFGEHWWSCDAPRHLFQFTRTTLRAHLERAGFREVEITTRSGPTSLVRALRHLINATFGTRLAHDPKLLTHVAEVWTVMMSLVRFFGVGSELRVTAVRPR